MSTFFVFSFEFVDRQNKIQFISNKATICTVNDSTFNISDILIYDIQIDVVIPWSGPTEYAMKQEHDYEAARDKDSQELKYTLRSIVKNANWISNIYILVNGVVPQPSYVPQSITNRVHMINRCNIMPNGTCPTRNSFAVESYLHNIETLSEYYIIAHDDIFIGRKIGMNHFFTCFRNRILPYVWMKSPSYGHFYGKGFHKIYENYINLPFDKLPNSTAPAPHLWYPMRKSFAITLFKEYSDFFRFVTSHKFGRFSSKSNSSNDGINSQEECYRGVIQWWLLQTSNGIYKNIWTKELRHIWWDEWLSVPKTFEMQVMNTQSVFMDVNAVRTEREYEIYHKTMSKLFPNDNINTV